MRFKNLFVAVLAALASLVSGGCTTVSGFIQLDSPAARDAGFRPAPQTITITNTTQLVGTIMTLDRKTENGEIYPNETVVAESHYQPLPQNQLPVVILFHDDAGRYAGVVARVLDVGASAQSFSWIIRESDIARFGEHLQKPRASAPVYSPSSRIIKLRSEWYNGSVWKQFVNDTPHRLRVVVDGRQRADIGPGEVYALRAQVFYPGQVQPVSVNLFGFADGGTQTGTAEYQVWPQNQGVSASQEIISPYSLRYQ